MSGVKRAEVASGKDDLQPVRKRTVGTHGMPYLFSELKRITKAAIIVVEADEADFFTWTVHVTPEVLRVHDYASVVPYLEQWSRRTGNPPTIVLSITFPRVYPFEVPFVRVTRPRFQYQTGHVTIGGSICTPMLTSSGWVSMNVPSLIAATLVTLKEGGARVQLAPDVHCGCPYCDYTEEEARVAFTRVVNRYGWK